MNPTTLIQEALNIIASEPWHTDADHRAIEKIGSLLADAQRALATTQPDPAPPIDLAGVAAPIFAALAPREGGAAIAHLILRHAKGGSLDLVAQASVQCAIALNKALAESRDEGVIQQWLDRYGLAKEQGAGQ